MARLARGEYIDPDVTQIVHAVQRCVRRAFLCGSDELGGTSFEHRRGWIRDRMELLASVFAIDCLTYTVLSNHMHVVLRTRPDVVTTWSDEEVACRWLRVFPKRKHQDGTPAEPTRTEIAAITSDADRIDVLRRRLSDVSWWMRCLAENIARRANQEEGQSAGRFWQGRFKAQLLLDEMSLLACAAYVDLNPIRAAMAETPETSTFTGAKDRIDDLKLAAAAAKTRTDGTHDWERSSQCVRSGWLSPLEIDERTDAIGPAVSTTSRRASDKGFLTLPLTKYLELLDWTGRQIRADKRGSIPAELAPILKRLGLDSDNWCNLVSHFGRLFKRAAGTAASLSTEAKRRGQRYLHAPGLALIQP